MISFDSVFYVSASAQDFQVLLGPEPERKEFTQIQGAKPRETFDPNSFAFETKHRNSVWKGA